MDDFAAKRQALLESGVRMMDPDTVYVEAGVTVEAGPCCSQGPFCGEHGGGRELRDRAQHHTHRLHCGGWRCDQLLPVQ